MGQFWSRRMLRMWDLYFALLLGFKPVETLWENRILAIGKVEQIMICDLGEIDSKGQ